ncbi:hypothetical protein RTG_02392 [Rhodotorula toruloides ATCC 204091]|uniref:Uncharacterized protein n=1 Tax=Rhodotorula toruloides TaxID=5286 RepID=A0A0K3CCJ6_RHOTO|nr:hypothetical protein RTG_02392 [Rhodotorula toruloides ATCC 204091]PRQ74417.1 hypothetical protein AAT19DRAFT_14770 [Rhodotorula toruloides]
MCAQRTKFQNESGKARARNQPRNRQRSDERTRTRTKSSPHRDDGSILQPTAIKRLSRPKPQSSPPRLPPLLAAISPLSS